VDAEGRTSLKIPSPAGKSGGLICVDACRTDIDEVSGKRTFQRAVLETTEIGVVGNLHGSQVTVAGKLLIEPAASPTVDTPVHLVLNKDAKVLITIRPLLSKVVSDPMASCYGHVLKQTMPSFIADRAIVGMVHHEPFDDVFTEIDSFFIRRRYDHAIVSIHHAAHLDPFDRTFQKPHRTHSTGPDGSQTGMVAKPRDDDAEPRRCLNDFRPLLNFYFKTINH
jgi:hypothetical protein